MAEKFADKDLRGRSFKGRQDLARKDFSNADIRGVNFAGANLQGADFSKVRAGLQEQWTGILVVLSCLSAGGSGFLSVFSWYIISALINSTSGVYDRVIGLFLLLAVAILIPSLWLGRYKIVGATVVLCISGVVLTSTPSTQPIAVYKVITAITAAGFATLTGVAVVVLVGAIVKTESIVKTRTVVGLGISTGLGILVGVGILAEFRTVVGALAILLCNGFFGWQTIRGDDKYTPIWNRAIADAALGGTSFRCADLTDTDFTGAYLENSDFRQAILIGTCFRDANNLDLVRVGDSYLQSKQIRQLVAKGDVKDKNFDRQDLRGINLQDSHLQEASFNDADLRWANLKGAHLEKASFNGAKLGQANLQQARLSQAKLVRAQLDGTDFTGAILTGAYIQDWSVTTTTKFEGVECEEVYMREPTPDNPDPHRKPDNRKVPFKNGEFGDFIKPLFDTLDFYYSQGVDARAFALSFKKTAKNHPDVELKVVAIEHRGQGVMIRVQAASQADRSKLHEEISNNYNWIICLSPEQVAAIDAEKDEPKENLKQVINFFNTGIYFNPTINMIDNKNGFYVGNNSGKISNIQGNGNQVDQSTTPVSNLSQAQVLQQLTDLIGIVKESDLSTNDKAKIIEDLNATKTAVQTTDTKPEPNKPLALDRLTSADTLIKKASEIFKNSKTIWITAAPVIESISKWLGA